jgi:hypothetical protein
MHNAGDMTGLVPEPVIDPCVWCGLSTAPGFGRFVNRLPTWGGGDMDKDGNIIVPPFEGYACAGCAGFQCERCDKQIGLDEEIRVNDMNDRILTEAGILTYSDDVSSEPVHRHCATHEEIKAYEDFGEE